jgi:ribosomal protein L11 methyltransferase
MWWITVENKKFVEVKVKFKVSDVSKLEEINALAMSDYCCDGIQEFSLDEPTVDDILGERAYSGGDIPGEVIDEVNEVARSEYLSLLYFFYESETILQDAKIFKEYLSKIDLVESAELTERPWDDWNKEWRKFYSPIVVSDELVIVPEWQKDDSSFADENSIYIYPGMGFGTGEHETTYLCLKHFVEIQDKLSNDATCLDFGCGSGILGIAAIKKLNMPVCFCDIDTLALNNCLQNLELNFSGENLSGTNLVSRERFTPSIQHELVFANILENVLIEEKDELLKSVKDNGYLIVSGLLNHQVENIINEYKGFKSLGVHTKKDWSAILFQKI